MYALDSQVNPKAIGFGVPYLTDNKNNNGYQLHMAYNKYLG